MSDTKIYIFEFQAANNPEGTAALVPAADQEQATTIFLQSVVHDSIIRTVELSADSAEYNGISLDWYHANPTISSVFIFNALIEPESIPGEMVPGYVPPVENDQSEQTEQPPTNGE